MEPLSSILDWLCTDPVGILVGLAIVLSVAVIIYGLVERTFDQYVRDKICIAYDQGFVAGRDHGFEDGKQAGIDEGYTERYIEVSLDSLEALANGEL